MRIKLKGPNGVEQLLDLPGGTDEDRELLCRWLARLLIRTDVMAHGSIPVYYTLEIW